jgi:hypothetical protein
MQPLENSGGLTAYGLLIALGLLVIWAVLLIPLSRGRLKTAPFLTASIVFAFLIVFFWLWPTITEISFGKLGSIKTNVEQVRVYLSQIKAIEGEVRDVNDRIKADATRAQERVAEIQRQAAITEERFMTERRITARDRWQMETIVHTMLPRRLAPIADLVPALKGLGPTNVAIVDKIEPRLFGEQMVRLFEQAGIMGHVIWLPDENDHRFTTDFFGVSMYAATERGRKVAEIYGSRNISLARSAAAELPRSVGRRSPKTRTPSSSASTMRCCSR